MEITESRYLLCLVLQDVDLFNALRIVIITPMRLLKRRYNIYFKANNTMCHCYGSIYCILSDHPSQALVYDAHVVMLKDSNEGVCGKVGPTDEKIKVHGWGQQRHLQYTSTVHGLEEELNKAFKAFPPFPGKQSFANRTQIVRRNPNGKVVVAGLTGGEMDSFLQVAELLFKERVSDPQERECWQIHVDILEKLTKRWKHLMVKFYGGVAERQRATSLKKTRLKKRSKKWSRTAETVASDMMTSGEKPLSFKFPNFEVAQHWPELIRFLGPPWVQDTRLWEQRHLAAKMTAHRMNQINTERAILVKTHQKDAVIRHRAYAGLPRVSSVDGSRKEPYTLSVRGTTTSITRDRRRNLFDAVSRELGEGVQIVDDITSHKSAHYYGHFLRPGDGIALRVPEDYPNIRFIIDNSRHAILDESETQCVMIGRISRLLRIACDNVVKAWVELELGDLRGVSDGFLEFRLSQRRFYLPFGWNGWTVAKRVHLVQQHAGLLYNHRVRWHLGDRWATPASGARPAAWSTTSAIGGAEHDQHDD
ncbi:uncharacterized protein ACA1_247210 [Acanthamoeba castellanii str. Neff]|uniref:Uncharacterized protein n=1 Tax=Acanthamoeba castellanii (strain ATCC 30010 / Neff) TaxID=1257118 RepID=L8GKG6_ACACF|nr:uncharacterized protein ACA1_247210 [Acanthamoeba castellanii str. Neff]ELR13517.1 hypothetical protein ACA1_247210 [Acanthamoeba castellanii str. Neff]